MKISRQRQRSFHGNQRLKLPYTLNFSGYSDGNLPVLSGSTWSIASGKAINTPTLGTENITNGNMEVITGWFDNGTSTVFERSSEQSHAGTYSLKTVSDAVNEGPRQVKAVTQWTWHSIEGWVYLTSGSFRFGDQNGRIVNAPTITTPAGEWQKVIHTGWISVAGNAYVGALARTAVSQFYLDDISWKPLTTTSMPASIESKRSDIIASITFTAASYAWAGVWICQDAAKSNGIVACHNGVQIALVKVVDGVWSEVVAPTTASFGNDVEVRKTGTNVKLFCRGIQIGVDKTIADVSIISNTLHGPMSTHPDNLLQTFCLRSGTPRSLTDPVTGGATGRFIWLSDTHIDNGVEDTATKLANLITYINAMSPLPDFVVFSGDNVADGSITQHYVDLMAKLADLDIPYYTVPGNHDQEGGAALTNYDNYLTNRHFVKVIGNITLIGFTSLNSSTGGLFHAKVEASELTWIETQLASADPAKDIILLSHHGLGDYRNSDMCINQSEGGSDLVTLCGTYGVKAHLSGHVHASRFDSVNYYSGIQSVTSSAFWGNGASSPYANGIYTVCNVFNNRVELDVRDATTNVSIPASGDPSYNLVVI